MPEPGHYLIGWICALHAELVAAQVFLDEEYDEVETLAENDHCLYKFGRIGKHNVVIAVLPEYGTSSAACVARDLQHTFPNIKVGLMVGVGGGAPGKHDVRLGDVVVSCPRGGKGGVYQFDYGKAIQDRDFVFATTGSLNQPPWPLLAAAKRLQARYDLEGHQISDDIERALGKIKRKQKYCRPPAATDKLYRSSFRHPAAAGACSEACGDEPSRLVKRAERDENDSPAIHYGLIASSNTLMRDAVVRDRLAAEEDILCFEMEAAGLMNHFPCIVIRGICDYSDSHKNKQWQGYAALVAAAYAKDLVSYISPQHILAERSLKELLSGISDHLDETRENTGTIRAVVENEEDEKILRWITATDYTSRYNTLIRERQADTGDWFLGSPEFQTWHQGDKQTLFCPGIPGAGKTILASLAIKRILEMVREAENVGLAFLYCTPQQRDQQSSYDFLASLVKQLARTRTRLPENIRKLYRYHSSNQTQTQASFDELSTALNDIAGTYSKVFIVVDALDECQMDERLDLLLPQLFHLQDRTSTSVLATSRPLPHIRDMFAGRSVELKIEAKDEDLEKYLDRQMAHIPLLSEKINDVPRKGEQALKCRIKAAVIDAASGMFLLAKLHFNSLVDKTTLYRLDEALDDLPRGNLALHQAYTTSMKRLQNQRPGFRRLAERTLTLLSCAERMLTVRELQDALSVRVGDTRLDAGRREFPSIIASACVGLVVVDDENGVVGLVHETTREYLVTHMCCIAPQDMSGSPGRDHEICNDMTNRMALKEAHRNLANICLTYLAFDVFESGKQWWPQESRAKRALDYPFYEYANHSWGYHARAAEDDMIVSDFLESEAKVLAASREVDASSRLEHVWAQQMTGLQLAAYFGLRNTAGKLLARGRDVNAVSQESPWTSLSWAARNGHEATVELLLQSGADTELAYLGLTPLSYAAENGHKAVVGMLLAYGAQTRSCHQDYQNVPLIRAIDSGHEAIYKLLVDKGGASLDLDDDRGRTPLCSAVRRGHRGIVEHLLRVGGVHLVRGPEPSHDRRSAFLSPLACAAAKGRWELAKLLLKNGADVEGGDHGRRKPLQLARIRKDEKMVRLLIEHGARDGAPLGPR